MGTAHPLAAFEASLDSAEPPATLAAPLQALWWDRKGNWDRAHGIVAPLEGSRSAAWVHAYLHRREGDAFNARYWYGRAGRPVSPESLEAECRTIAAALLAGDGDG